jgi:hypothetical protein
LAECVPERLAATALTIYGTVGIGAPTAVLILASGQLYSHFGAHGFWVMAVICAAALPLPSNAARVYLQSELIFFSGLASFGGGFGRVFDGIPKIPVRT